MNSATLVDGETESNNLDTLEKGKDDGNAEVDEKIVEQHTDDAGNSNVDDAAVDETGSQDAVSEANSDDESDEYPKPFVDDDGFPRCTCGWEVVDGLCQGRGCHRKYSSVSILIHLQYLTLTILMPS